jgi:carbonic anhydrase/acetyltransferase-like protein (isoleucine patch superfamily)
LRNGIWIDEGICDSIVIGDNSIVGEGCMLQGCAIDENVKVGHNCVVLEGAKIERDSILDNNSTLSAAKVIPSGQLWAGSPATYVRDLTPEEIADIRTESDQM